MLLFLFLFFGLVWFLGFGLIGFFLFFLSYYSYWICRRVDPLLKMIGIGWNKKKDGKDKPESPRKSNRTQVGVDSRRKKTERKKRRKRKSSEGGAFAKARTALARFPLSLCFSSWIISIHRFI